ncbi:MAG: YukJ family protein [Bacillus sp. (in: firmicutes)]
MPLRNYTLLKGKIVNTAIGKSGKPHFEIHVTDDQETNYRIAVNIESGIRPSEVLYYVSENFNSEHVTKLPALNSGFTSITKDNRDIALDYVRGGLFNPKEMVALPPFKSGPNNDLKEKVEFYVNKAMKNNAVIYAYGEGWGPEENEPDKYFDFLPGYGIHDIHMNQGNTGKWKNDDGIWQDGGMLLHFEEENRWVGIFLAFQSQSWCTDENGHALKPVRECNHRNYRRV